MLINAKYKGTMWCEIRHLKQDSSMSPKYDHVKTEYCPESPGRKKNASSLLFRCQDTDQIVCLVLTYYVNIIQ